MRALFVAAFTLVVVHATARASTAVEAPQALKQLSLEELFDLEVTSVSQKPESLSKTAAAVHVVTQDDIRRSGALSIPEALRAIPGVEVAQTDARTYAITARGFNGGTANKLLVLIDGRSVYTPLFSGVFWDVQDVFMEDIEQIEVIRGPGATVWGANAVNGVINVISKDASQTQGFLVSGGAGDFENGFGGARYGGTFGSKAAFRIYGKYFDRGPSLRPNGQDAGDEFHIGQGGLRVDWSPTAADKVTFQGDGYVGHEDQGVIGPLDVGGANAIVRWSRQLSPTSEFQLHTYFDRTDRGLSTIADIVDTYDAELRHRFAPASGHDLVWGATYRRTHDDVHNNPSAAFIPARVSHDLYSGFVQDEWTTARNRLRLTLGSKFEHNDYTGLEIQPSGRLAWSATNGQTIWGAVSRAIRAPSRIDHDLYSPAVPPYLLAGGPNFDSEVLLAYELGYKFQPAATVTASIATFYNRYSRLRSLEGGPPPYVFANGLRGEAHGLETEVNWQPASAWRFDFGYTYFYLSLSVEPGKTDASQGTTQEGDSPRHQAYVRSSLSVTGSLAVDVTTRYVSELEHQQVPCYVAADLHVGWQPTHALELGVYGRNLFDKSHPEFGTPAARREVPRSLFGKVTCRF